MDLLDAEAKDRLVFVLVARYRESGILFVGLSIPVIICRVNVMI